VVDIIWYLIQLQLSREDNLFNTKQSTNAKQGKEMGRRKKERGKGQKEGLGSKTYLFWPLPKVGTASFLTFFVVAEKSALWSVVQVIGQLSAEFIA
jgi:hypothetical protein